MTGPRPSPCSTTSRLRASCLWPGLPIGGRRRTVSASQQVGASYWEAKTHRLSLALFLAASGVYTWPGRSVRGPPARGPVLPLFSPPSHTTTHRNIVSLIVTVLLLHCYIAELCHTQRTAIHSAHVTCSLCHTVPLCHVYHSTTYIAHMWHVASCHTPCHTYHSATPSAHVTCSLMPHATPPHCAHTVSCTHCVMRRRTYAHHVTHTHCIHVYMRTLYHTFRAVFHLDTCTHAGTVWRAEASSPHD